MTTQFPSPDVAKAYAASLAGVDPTKTDFTEDLDLHVTSPLGPFEGKEEISKSLRADEEARLKHQVGYRFKNSDGQEVAIVIEPFRDEFCLWLVNQSQGTCFRV